MKPRTAKSKAQMARFRVVGLAPLTGAGYLRRRVVGTVRLGPGTSLQEVAGAVLDGLTSDVDWPRDVYSLTFKISVRRPTPPQRISVNDH